MSSQPLVFVLILNYCSAEDTIACVEAVRASEYKNVRLLVLDNCSPDGSGAVLRNRLPEEEFVQIHRNTGYAGGNNIGIGIAIRSGAEFVFVVNPDVRLGRDSISECFKIMSTDAQIGAVNPVQLDGSGYRFDEKFREGIFEHNRIREPQVPIEACECWDVPTLYGAGLFLSVAALKKVGGFDPMFFAYGEEEDLARRIRAKGFRLVVTTAGAVRHLRSNEQSSVSDFVLFLRLKGAYLFNLKNPDVGFSWALRSFLRTLVMDVRGLRRNRYPFAQYPVKRKHVLKAGAWILVRLPLVYAHRRLDLTAPYLELA